NVFAARLQGRKDGGAHLKKVGSRTPHKGKLLLQGLIFLRQRFVFLFSFVSSSFGLFGPDTLGLKKISKVLYFFVWGHRMSLRCS
ncbi:MAG: hypothetical protein ACI4SY_00870, partial [Sutterella sp.]